MFALTAPAGIVGVGPLNGEIIISHSDADQDATPGWMCPGDVTDYGVVNGLDLLMLFSQWGTCGDPLDCTADINCDGLVDGFDLLMLLAAWGDYPKPAVRDCARRTAMRRKSEARIAALVGEGG